MKITNDQLNELLRQFKEGFIFSTAWPKNEDLANELLAARQENDTLKELSGRAITLLEAAGNFIDKNELVYDDYLVFYDGADWDGQCLLADINILLKEIEGTFIGLEKK
jgi:hypothetical protein